MSFAKLRMPSAVFSVAIASSLNIQRNDFSSHLMRSIFAALATAVMSFGVMASLAA